MDTNEDGEVSDEEREAYYAAKRDEIDTDGDGEISDEERAAARAARCADGEMNEEEDDADEGVEIAALRSEETPNATVETVTAVRLLTIAPATMAARLDAATAAARSLASFSTTTQTEMANSLTKRKQQPSKRAAQNSRPLRHRRRRRAFGR